MTLISVVIAAISEGAQSHPAPHVLDGDRSIQGNPFKGTSSSRPPSSAVEGTIFHEEVPTWTT